MLFKLYGIDKCLIISNITFGTVGLHICRALHPSRRTRQTLHMHDISPHFPETKRQALLQSYNIMAGSHRDWMHNCYNSTLHVSIVPFSSIRIIETLLTTG
jgi:hypothetical protein